MKQKLTGKLVIPLAGTTTAEQPRKKPHNPRTQPQQTQRGYLASISAHWRELTDEARASWESLAAQLKHRPSGHQVYVQVNIILTRCGLPQVELPPALPAFGILDCAGLLADNTPQLKLLGVRTTLAADRLIIQATPPVSAGIQNVERRFREVAIVPGPTPVPADVDFTAAYIARFGPPKPGNRIFVHITQVNNGFKALAYLCSALVGEGKK